MRGYVLLCSIKNDQNLKNQIKRCSCTPDSPVKFLEFCFIMMIIGNREAICPRKIRTSLTCL
jgi:hypothetical protein